MAEAILKVKVKLIEGQYFDRLEEHERMFEEMMERDLRERVIGLSRHGERRARAMLKHVLPVFGANHPGAGHAAGPGGLQVAAATSRAAPATTVKELAFMKAAFNVTIREWE